MDTSPLRNISHRSTSIQHVCVEIVRKTGSHTWLKNVNIRTISNTHYFVATNSLSEHSSLRRKVYCIRHLKWEINISCRKQWKVENKQIFTISQLIYFKMNHAVHLFFSTTPVILLEDFCYVLTFVYQGSLKKCLITFYQSLILSGCLLHGQCSFCLKFCKFSFNLSLYSLKRFFINVLFFC